MIEDGFSAENVYNNEVSPVPELCKGLTLTVPCQSVPF